MKNPKDMSELIQQVKEDGSMIVVIGSESWTVEYLGEHTLDDSTEPEEDSQPEPQPEPEEDTWVNPMSRVIAHSILPEVMAEHRRNYDPAKLKEASQHIEAILNNTSVDSIMEHLNTLTLSPNIEVVVMSALAMTHMKLAMDN